MNVTVMKKAVQLCIRARITPWIWGRHGLGKSQGILQLTQEEGIGMIDMRCSQLEAPDLRGLPDREIKDGKVTRTVYLAPADLPGEDYCSPACTLYREEGCMHEICKKRKEEWEKDPANAEPYCQGVLLLDELNRAPDDVLQAVFQLVLDRAIGTYVMPKGWSTVVAGNYSEGYTVNNFNDDAFLDRFCHMDLIVDGDYMNDWFYYISKKFPDMAPKIVQFVAFNDDHLVSSKNVDKGFNIAPSPRSWEVMGRVLEEVHRNRYDKNVILAVMSGIVGHEVALSFDQFNTDVVPTDIINNFQKVEKKVADLTRNALIGLVWGVVSNSKELGTGKKDTWKEDERKMNNVLDFMRWVASGGKDNDLAVMLGRALCEAEMEGLAGAVLSNPNLAQLTQKFSKSKNPTWVSLINKRPNLQKLMSDVSFGQ